ncbi:hypothetical protein KS4_30350 [Poriferisphaera corsica]|uniref:Uncharacterized protein n=1 Tax=Poriferisphaera corsica TaxID=2528020 RepID=A0A517YXK4_9BACT|nr:hypothetical protein KS4_30350 [Poriferisphaera corsica]
MGAAVVFEVGLRVAEEVVFVELDGLVDGLLVDGGGPRFIVPYGCGVGAFGGGFADEDGEELCRLLLKVNRHEMII